MSNARQSKRAIGERHMIWQDAAGVGSSEFIGSDPNHLRSSNFPTQKDPQFYHKPLVTTVAIMLMARSSKSLGKI